MHRSHLIAFAAILIFFNQAFGAQTGSFNLKVPFQDTTRMLSVYVATTYDSTQAYRLMICLHGLGDNSANFRNALVSSLQWKTNFPNTIFVCPEAATTTADFYDGLGGEAIVDTSMKWAMTKYHIDTSEVILEGFSLGGRAALKYGLEHYTLFKGLLLNTPAIQGVKNALNDQPTYTYDYANGSKIPIYVTHGKDDLFYTAPIDSMLKQLVLNDAKVTFRDIEGMGHSIPTFGLMSDVLTFFDTPGLIAKDLNLVEAEVPVRTCETALTPRLLVQNTGSTTIDSATVIYDLGTGPQYYTWRGSLLTFQHTYIDLPAITGTDGNNTLTVTVVSLDNVGDSIDRNNIALATTQIESKAQSLPLTEAFSNQDFLRSWSFLPAGDIQSGWSLDSTVHRTGAASLFNFDGLFLFDNLGRAEGLLTPVVDLSSISNPKLSFDYAFNYLEYTPPYFTQITDLTDTLEVLISTDCGSTWTSLFKKWGADLATFSEPIVNALSVEEGFASPEDTNWRRVSIDLGAYATATNATIKFNYISGLGGSFSLDRVAIDNTSDVKPVTVDATWVAYPNPANERLVIPATVGSAITLTDAAGNEVRRLQASSTTVMDTHTLPSGTYLLSTRSSSRSHSQKVVIRR